MNLSLSRRAGLWIGLGLGAVTLVVVIRLYFDPVPFSPLLTLLSVVAWATLLLAPIAIVLDASFRAKGKALTPSALLDRWRVLLPFVVGLMPIAVLLTMYFNLEFGVELQAAVTCGDPSLTTCTLPPMDPPIDWTSQALSLVATTISLWGVILLAAALAVRLKEQPRLLNVLLAAGAIIIAVAATQSGQYVAFDIPILRIVLAVIAPYALARWLSRKYSPDNAPLSL